MLPALSASQEDYLETIWRLGHGGSVRPSAVAGSLAVRRSSVTKALRVLAGRGLVEQPRYGAVSLTPAGRIQAQEVEARHGCLQEFLTVVLGLPEPAAAAAACRLEHELPEGARARLTSLVRFMASPAGRSGTVGQRFQAFIQAGERS